LAIQANYYSVSLQIQRDSASEALRVLCTKRSRLWKLGHQVMVGDRVVVEEVDWNGRRGVITDVLPRKTQLNRPPVANADQVLLMFALAEPDLDPFQVTEFLTVIAATGLEVHLCLNKADLVPAQQQQAWCDRIQAWGYHLSLISLHTHYGLDTLQSYLQQKITVVSGPSGVGKSSLINYLVPTVNQTVGHVSGKLARGRHTTRHVELFQLPGQGFLADSPGFNRATLDCSPHELALLFPEAQQRLRQGSCRYHNCLHRDEPGCVVRGDWERYSYYLTLLDGVIARQEQLNQTSAPESSAKVKTKLGGKRCYEPKLAAKKYRRTSRKASQQALQKFYQDLD
ncbi:MAG: small ribosomal subunit biogenesis GTPase RsgA, partial [Cyanobacteria bacterium]|nr:small ribosomal subunit biogenesis GTPase RsgA [Cyanobacteriota bacterium]MDW8201861.1 small ribosomal subunit biogenesis GTPase RsgA [Cyanobacteriota bacterium SKYGB_h_bin112]